MCYLSLDITPLDFAHYSPYHTTETTDRKYFFIPVCYCSLVPRSSNGFCRCFAFQIGKICYHHCIIRHFQFRKCLPVNSNSGLSVCYLQIKALRSAYLAGWIGMLIAELPLLIKNDKQIQTFLSMTPAKKSPGSRYLRQAYSRPRSLLRAVRQYA